MTKVLLISILASLGAAAVAWGLFLESFKEKPKYRDIKEFRSAERKSHCGQKWVLWGVIAEIILGFGIAIWEGSASVKSGKQLEAAETNITRIDPANLPVLNLNAFAALRVKGKEFPDLTQWDSIPLSTNWGSKTVTATLSGNLPTMISDDFGVGKGFPDFREYFLNFRMESVSAAMDLPLQSASKSLGAANFISLDVKCLPPQSEILGGYAFVVVNNSLWRLFRIYPQKDTRPPFPNKEQAEILSKRPPIKGFFVVNITGQKDAVTGTKISTLEPGKLTSLTNGEMVPEEATFFPADFVIVGTNVPSGKFDPNW